MDMSHVRIPAQPSFLCSFRNPAAGELSETQALPGTPGKAAGYKQAPSTFQSCSSACFWQLKDHLRWTGSGFQSQIGQGSSKATHSVS